jgi:hypothetical protein
VIAIRAQRYSALIAGSTVADGWFRSGTTGEAIRFSLVLSKIHRKNPAD